MDKYTFYRGKKLRNGYTTGSCAAAAAKAACLVLTQDSWPDQVVLDLPSQDQTSPDQLTVPVYGLKEGEGWAQASCDKDGGDDIDATDGMEIRARVQFSDQDGIFIDGGEGIGRVTKQGLAEPVGAAAINPIPRQMIADNIRPFLPAGKGFQVLVIAPKGEEVAQKTMNADLGVLGGISILGTTGLVRPMSEEALTESISLDLSVRFNEGISRLVLVPGNYGRDFAVQEMGIDPARVLSMSNFVGHSLDEAQRLGFEDLLLVGHLGKFVKIAGGIFHTHSHLADARMEILTAYLGLLGMETADLKKVFASNTTEEATGLILDLGYREVFQVLAQRIKARCRQRMKRNGGKVPLEAVLFSSDHGFLASSADFHSLCSKWSALGSGPDRDLGAGYKKKCDPEDQGKEEKG